MRKAQGSLEYLIIIAAVLAIAAIVVLFMTGAFKSSSASADVAACKQAASDCAQTLATSNLADCSDTDICSVCDDNTMASSCAEYDSATDACNEGHPECIVAA